MSSFCYRCRIFIQPAHSECAGIDREFGAEESFAALFTVCSLSLIFLTSPFTIVFTEMRVMNGGMSEVGFVDPHDPTGATQTSPSSLAFNRHVFAVIYASQPTNSFSERVVSHANRAACEALIIPTQSHATSLLFRFFPSPTAPSNRFSALLKHSFRRYFAERRNIRTAASSSLSVCVIC